MNTTPILTAVALLAAGLPAFSQDDPFGAPPEPRRLKPQPADTAPTDPFAGPDHQPRKIRRPAPHPADPFAAPAPSPQDQALLQIIPNLDVQETSLFEVVDHLQEIAEKPLNFVVKEPANDVQIRSMRLRNVSMQTVLDTIEALAPVRVATIPGQGDGAPVIVIEAREMPRPEFRPTGTTAHPLDPDARSAEQYLAEGLGPKHPRVIAALGKRKASSVTRAYPVRPMLDTVKMESLLELINEFWDRSEPGWSESWGENAISLHEQSGMLIVRAPMERHEELDNLLKGLNSTVEAARSDQQAVEEVRKQLRELEHRGEIAMRTAEEQRAIRSNAEAKFRQQLEEKNQQLKDLDRIISELKHELEQAKSPE